MSTQDRIYFVTRAAEEAELAEQAAGKAAEAAHRALQRQYVERASVGDRTVPQPQVAS